MTAFVRIWKNEINLICFQTEVREIHAGTTCSKPRFAGHAKTISLWGIIRRKTKKKRRKKKEQEWYSLDEVGPIMWVLYLLPPKRQL